MSTMSFNLIYMDIIIFEIWNQKFPKISISHRFFLTIYPIVIFPINIPFIKITIAEVCTITMGSPP